MFISTRNNTEKVYASEAIMNGMVPEGGLYLPESLPKIDLETLKKHIDDSYQDLAIWILDILLDDFTKEEITDCVQRAYSNDTFENIDVTPIVKLNNNRYVLELWHGPTAAFKDVALQIMPHLLVKSIRKNNCQNDLVILVATSGDTGKAALEGFKNISGTQIIVFYPDGGVSHIQELQMLTTVGENTHIVAVEGNFDNCQTAVKEIFADQAMIDEIDKLGYQFSSANSINWGRLSPQVVYYFSAYFQLIKKGEIQIGDSINFAVPTGNFGNILAGWIAKQMGLPVGKLVCASNENNVLNDFFKTGTYNTNRAFMKTISPSMDILVSSNLERYLFYKNGQNGEKIAQWMQDLKEKGQFTVSAELLESMKEDIVSGECSDQITKDTIRNIYKNTHYLLDTHTAVAMHVVDDIGLDGLFVIDSTANPYKFVEAVSESINPDMTNTDNDGLELLKMLEAKSKMPVHRALNHLDKLEIFPHDVIKIEDIRQTVIKLLKENTRY